METIKLYRNYGCLAAEKRVVYTYGQQASSAVCSDIIEVKLPDGWQAEVSPWGFLLVTAPWGWVYEMQEILAGNEHPCFIVHDDKQKKHVLQLKVV